MNQNPASLLSPTVKALPLLLCLLFLLSACEGNTRQRRADRGENYVPDADHLFFKNTRQREYAAEERAEGLTVFLHDDLRASNARVVPIIIDNWLNDRARLRFDLRADGQTVTPERPFRLDVEQDAGWEVIPLTVPPTNAELARLRFHLGTSRDVRAVSGLDTLEAFPGPARRFAKEVLDDYLRLVNHRN